MNPQKALNLNSSISSLFMVGPIYANRLAKLGIFTIEDLFYHFPSRYDDYSLVSKISLLQNGETVTVRGKIISLKNVYTKNGKNIQEGEVVDETGKITAIWFNQPFLIKNLNTEEKVSLSGKVSWFGKKLVLLSPDYELIKKDIPSIHTGRLVPVYKETYGISSKWIRSKISFLLPYIIPQINDYFDEKTVVKNNFYDRKKALKSIHFPENILDFQKAKERLSFDELFLLQLESQKRKQEWQKNSMGVVFKINSFKKEMQDLYKKIPFKLTNSQNKVVEEITNDLIKKTPMNRLLQGEVGSGKTIVALISMYLSYLNGYQSVLMAPTEILAFQHYETIRSFLNPLGVKIGLFTSTTKNNTQYVTRNGQFDIYIGTHALLSEKLKIEKLAFVIIDEQHRFGVEQRAKLQKKGLNPHLLSITATPIPRTVALTVFSELDLSIIDEIPEGRKKIKTFVVPKEKRDNAYKWIEKQILDNHSQCFIICPLIEESETLKSIKAVSSEFARLKKDIFPDLKLGLLHGKLKNKEKSEILESFRKGNIDILVATPVVEVGIDIKNATVMLIEEAERFGLAQLHQLRGRVGRGTKNSYCLLFTNSETKNTILRLKKMEETDIGIKLAEYDLQLRGPGEIYGVRQHGIPELKIASYNDLKLIEKAKRAASEIIEKDFNLNKFPELKSKIQKKINASVTPN